MADGTSCDACSFKASSPEMAAFAKMLVENVREVSRQESRQLAREISALIDEKIQHIDTKLESIKTELGAHGVRIAAIEQRLSDGERRFSNLEAQQRATEKDGVKTQVDLATLAATIGKTAIAGGVGGGVVAAISKMLGG